MLERIQKVAALLRDVGVILGVPVVLYMLAQLYSLQRESTQAQIASLKEQVETLKERQYDRAATIIKAQKDVSEAELDAIQKSKSVLGKPVNIRNLDSKLLCLNLAKQGASQ